MWTNTEKTKNEQHEPHQKPGINSGALAWKGSNSCSTCGISHVAHGDSQSPVNDVKYLRKFPLKFPLVCHSTCKVNFDARWNLIVWDVNEPY